MTTLMNSDSINAIPDEVKYVTETLESAGFEAYLVGGCVRDLLLNRIPKDWDITTNATPEQIVEHFAKTFYENRFGTVSVVNEQTEDSRLKVIEVTPYRVESTYSDNRRPDSVEFGTSLNNDLQRRDFTINAIAYNISKGQLIDPYKGQRDLAESTLRTVGDANVRFGEDALRMLRAIRISSELGFTISLETMNAISSNNNLLKNIAIERIRDEFIKIIESPNPMTGIVVAQKLGVLQHIVPELEDGIGVEQNGDHIFTVWEHNLRSLQHAADKGWPLHVKLAALFHDIAKPETRRWSKDKNDWTFYGHDVVGGKVTRNLMRRLKFSSDLTDTVSKLVRYHLFFSDVDKITLSAVRRIIVNVGEENVWDLMKLRACDRIGMGRPKEKPYRLRKYHAMIEEALRAPVSVGMLKIDGRKIIDVTHETPGKRIGYILNALLGETLDNPDLNNSEFLVKRAIELSKLPDKELIPLSDKGRLTQDEKEQEELKEIRKRHAV